jgi:hypothetical protein
MWHRDAAVPGFSRNRPAAQLSLLHFEDSGSLQMVLDFTIAREPDVHAITAGE